VRQSDTLCEGVGGGGGDERKDRKKESGFDESEGGRLYRKGSVELRKSGEEEGSEKFRITVDKTRSQFCGGRESEIRRKQEVNESGVKK